MLLIFDPGDCGHDFCGPGWTNVIGYRPRLHQYLFSAGLLYGFSYFIALFKVGWTDS